MANFKFLRTEPPDVMRYLPDYLAEDESFRKIQNGLSEEHGIQKEMLADIARQFFVDTATWGLSSWERIYRTEPPLGADYPLRRTLIKTKMLGRQVMTKKNTELIINQYTNNGKGYVVEDAAPGAISIVLPCNVEHPDMLAKALNEMLPAHLQYSFRLVIHDVDANGNIDMEGGIHQYHGIARSIGGRKRISYGFDDFVPESRFESRYGIASIRHGNKVIGGSTEIELNSGLFTGSFNAVSGVRTLEADWPDDLPVPKHEFHFEGHGVLSGGIACVNAGYRIIDVEIPKDLPKKPTEFHFMDNAGLAGGLVYTVSGMRTIFAEDVTFTHEPVNINIEETGSLYGSAVHVYKGVRTIETERVDLPVDTEYNVTETATLFKGIIDACTGTRKLGLEVDFKNYEHALNAGALNIVTGTRILKAGIISNDDAVEATARAGATTFKNGSIKMRFATGVPDEIMTETAAAVYSTTTGIRAGGIETPANMKNSVAYNTLNIAGGFKTVDVDASRAERYIESGKSAVNMKCSTLTTINRKYSMKLAGFKATTKYTDGGMMSCNISAGTAVSLYKTYYVSHKEEENNE